MSITELNDLFAQPNDGLPEDVSAELQSIARLHSLSEQELFFKWEAYSLKLGAENTILNYKTVRDFKKDLQDALERESRGKAAVHSTAKKTVNSTPRPATTADVYGVLDGLVSGTPAPRTAIKRRNDYETPAPKTSRTAAKSSPHGANGTVETTQKSFAERSNPGQIVESLNSHLDVASTEPSDHTEARVKLKSNTEMNKFNYRSMAMKLSEASEILDDRIDEFTALVQEHHGFPDAAFGNPAARSTSEIIAVGRIASDSEASIDVPSLILETSRRMGAGLRVPLKIDDQPFQLFPGKVVALRGINAAGESFKATELLSVPLLTPAASTLPELEVHHARLGINPEQPTSTQPLNFQIASGPYTPDTDLSFSALHTLLQRTAETKADVLILTGPFIDIEHPQIASGDFSLPDTYPIPADQQTLTDVFKAFITQPLLKLSQQSPTTTIILVPSVRDAVLKHVSYPQDRLQKKELGLPKQVTCVTNPMTIVINELVVGISSHDVLLEMHHQWVSRGPANDRLARLTAEVIGQRHFFPVFPPLDPASEKLPRPAPVEVKAPEGSAADVVAAADGVVGRRTATGAMLDLSYLKLGEWLHIRPDLLILPSALTPFAKVVDRVVAVNPGSLSKKRGAGTFAEMKILPRVVREEEKGERVVAHELFDRARVDVVRI